MCIAILNPKGTRLSKDRFKNCWDNNFNGAGFMYNTPDGRLHVVKEMLSFEKIYGKYRKLRIKYEDATFVLHFRISTHGAVNHENCHPFKVNNQLGFVHNGVISGVGTSVQYSDTNMFNRTMLRKIDGIDIKFLSLEPIKVLFDKFINHSKLIFMDNNGEWSIIGEAKGHWKDGMWFSNDSYDRVKQTIDYGGKSVSRSSLSGGSSQGRIGYQYPSTTSSLGSSSGYETNYWKSSSYKTNPDIFKGDKYLISDGTVNCETCGCFTYENELMSSDCVCLTCLKQSDVAEVIQDAVDDGAVLQSAKSGVQIVDYDKTYDKAVKEGFKNNNLPFFDEESETFDFEESDDNEEMCDCCREVVPSGEITDIAEWKTKACRSCHQQFIASGFIEA